MMNIVRTCFANLMFQSLIHTVEIQDTTPGVCSQKSVCNLPFVIPFTMRFHIVRHVNNINFEILSVTLCTQTCISLREWKKASESIYSFM